MKASRRFRREAARKAADDAHRRKIARAIGSWEVAVEGTRRRQFRHWEEARRRAARIEAAALERLPELLETFEARITERGGAVHWAEDAAEARAVVLELLEGIGARSVVKSKSMTCEEIELEPALAARGIRSLETDLGEFIVQLAGEKPYHIVTPAMHKSREAIAELFERELGRGAGMSAEELTGVARRHLRAAWGEADAGISGANFLVAREGCVVVTENEGNARLSMSCPDLHIAVAGIEKVLPRLADLSLFLPLLATSGTGQAITGYNSILRGPRGEGERDGPRRLHVVLLDNGRSRLFATGSGRESLRCIRCGACLNACPVYRSVGGHAYGTTYQGPIGSVITPPLRGEREWGHLPFASSLCGACGDACPVGIDLERLLLRARAELPAEAWGGWWARRAFGLWARLASRRERLERWRPLLRLLLALARRFLPARLRARVPPLAPRSFARQWRARRAGTSRPAAGEAAGSGAEGEGGGGGKP